MRVRQTIIFISLLILLIFAGACEAESPAQPAPMPVVDIPSLAPQDAIGIAQEHSVSSPVSVWEKQASFYARQGGTKGWNAEYVGNGKWTVELRIRNSDGSITVHKWSVFERNLTAVYLGAFVG